ncbi:copper transporter [Serpentinicella sp. ANB-PHB4]|uniref:copper transporter n=1 Tax=Serpentinicella sp. ANB-PHB4 TaxID=3074076 RepID=UPI00285B0D1E|nr:copper transporter [Serpentinicella sp. ANB-PHB4]MDR5658176.1 copper transporter [Serpentinicella sp. ANB-PHB4]
MGVDYRYFISSIIAIFISLTIGILIGSNLVQDTLFIEQQRLLINNLEEQFETYKNEKYYLTKYNKTLKTDVEIRSEYLSRFHKELIKDKLEDISVSILNINGQYRDVEKMIETINQAGGKVVTSIEISEDFINMEEMDVNLPNVSLNNLSEEFVNYIISFILTKNKTELINFMYPNDLLKINIYESIDVIPSYIIINTGLISEDSLVKDMIINLKRKNIKIIAVENSNIVPADSYVPLFKEHNIPTIDNVDSLLGRTTLVYVLNGIYGNFGNKKHAEDLFPFTSL